MAMVDVDGSNLPADSQPKLDGLVWGWRPPCAQTVFIKWTGWTVSLSVGHK